MTFLSQVLVHKKEAAELKIRDNYAWHKILWSVFPESDQRKRDFLFRIDDIHPHFRVLLLSPNRPILPEWGKWQTKTVSDKFLMHPRYRFQFRANPTMKRSVDKRRIGIYAETKLREWLARKASDNGFDVNLDDLAVSAPIDTVFRRNGRHGKHVSVDFRGTLKVKDYGQFKEAFHNGIGTAKAFGFGMLMLQPFS